MIHYWWIGTQRTLYSKTCPSRLVSTIPIPLPLALEDPSIYNFQAKIDMMGFEETSGLVSDV
jgi:hypothetical protein